MPRRNSDKIRDAAERVRQVLQANRLKGKKSMPKGDLCRFAAVNPRMLRLANEYLRSNGIMALSAGKDYYLATTPEEIEEAYRFRKAYAMTILADLKFVKRAYIAAVKAQAAPQMKLL